MPDRRAQRQHTKVLRRRQQVIAKARQAPTRLFAGGDLHTQRTEATMLAYLGEFAQAHARLDTVQRQHPADAYLRQVRAYIRLLEGDLSPSAYRALRGDRTGRPRPPGMKAFDQAGVPVWDGQPIPGQRLLVWSNPGAFGYGDLIQTVRLVATAKTQSQAHLTLGCPPGLSRLLAALAGVDAFVETPLACLAGVDAHLPVEWLPVACPLTSSILQHVPYLVAEPEMIGSWRPRFSDRAVVHLGLHWVADARHGNAAVRTMRVADLAPVFTLEQTRWYSLQRGGSAELAPYPEVMDLGGIDAPDALFVHSAAVLTHVDAVICIDSSIGHLAGALARPVFMILGVLADPQWGVRTDGLALWYPETRVRQVHPQDLRGHDGSRRTPRDGWSGVVARLGEELDGFVRKTLARPR